MKKSLTLRNKKESAFNDYMKDLYFEGWEDSLTQDQIQWHWEEFFMAYPLSF